MHRSMWLLDTALAMALVSSIHLARNRTARKSPIEAAHNDHSFN